MAFAEGPQRVHDRHGRRRPFANWMKRLANLKSMHADSSTSRPSQTNLPPKGKKSSVQKHSPYSMSSRFDNGPTSHTAPGMSQRSHSSRSHSKNSISISNDSQMQPKSRAPTLATTAETTISDTGRSGAGTSTTVPRTEGDRDSTFSSPAPSLRSMTTTLTTLQSTTPTTNPVNQGLPNYGPTQPTQPASAVPAHLAPHAHPTTYHNAIANNVLTDDASVLTLASSSKRRRRNSLDTNASIRALAPTSLFGGSRESLPLSVLSGTIIHPGQADSASIRETTSSHYPRSAMNAERASLISASGVTAPALTSERNSYISSKPTGDGGSVRSGLLGHGVDRERGLYHTRNDSLGGMSIGKDRYRDRDMDRDGLSLREAVTAPASPMPM